MTSTTIKQSISETSPPNHLELLEGHLRELIPKLAAALAASFSRRTHAGVRMDREFTEDELNVYLENQLWLSLKDLERNDFLIKALLDAGRKLTNPAFSSAAEIIHNRMALPGEEITSEEAAKILNLSRTHVNSLIDSGKIGVFSKTEGGHRRISRAAVLNYKNQRRSRQRIGFDMMVKASEEMGLYGDD